jgi:polyisoprenoid-binding protein YceI
VTRYQLEGSVRVTARSTLHDVEARSSEMAGWLDAELSGGSLQVNSAYLELPAASITADNPLLTREISRRMDPRRHPLVRADIAPVTGHVDAVAEVDGKLTLHGVSRPVHGSAWVRIEADDALSVDGAVTLDVRRFDIRPPSMLGMRVRPEVDVRLRLRAVPEPAHSRDPGSVSDPAPG